MRTHLHTYVLVLLVSCLGCKAIDLGGVISYTDPDTGEVVETTVGNALADQVEESGEIIGGVAGKALGVATGNPVVGVSASALIAALIAGGAGKLRRKKPESSSEEAAS
jgi:hypothetical protein